MKISQEQKQRYFDRISSSLVTQYKELVDKFVMAYESRLFGNQFFLDIEYDNALRDLIYIRSEFKVHLHLCVKNGISKDSFAYEQCGGFYLRQLEDIELKSFISILKLSDPQYTYSKEEREKTTILMNKMASGILDELKLEDSL